MITDVRFGVFALVVFVATWLVMLSEGLFDNLTIGIAMTVIITVFIFASVKLIAYGVRHHS